MNNKKKKGKIISKRTTKKKYTKGVKKTKKRKIRFGRILLWIIFPAVLLYIISSCVQFPIRNIFISGNHILSDQEIIELVGIENYPSIFSVSSYALEKKLEANKYISVAQVKKKKLREVHINITENIPIMYYAYENKTVFSNKEKYDGEEGTMILINYVPTEKYERLLDGLIAMKESVRNRISQIEYVPDEVNDERFLCTMRDGNYVYITLGKIHSMDSYLDIVKSFESKKGFLYLDSGEYFEIKEN